MKLYTGYFILALCLPACGKKFTTPDGNRFLSATVTADPLTIASDSLVTITGQGFSTDPDLDRVYFNGTGAAVLQASATQLVVRVPAAGSTGNITLRVNGEQANGPLFTYPSGSRFLMSPLSGVDTTTITLTTAIRVGPAASTTVQFGSLPGKVLYTDSGRIIVSAPVGVQTGQLNIQTNGQQYAGPVFTRTTIKSISPNIQGAGSGTIQIIGTGFNPIPVQNGVTFTQSGTGSRVSATVVSGSVDTLVVQIPASAGTGPITVNPNNQNVVSGPVFTLFGISTLNSQPYAFPYAYTSGVLQLLRGSGFNPDVSQNHITVNGLACTVTYVSRTGDSILYYLPDVVNPPNIGTADGPFVLQSGNLVTTATVGYANNYYQEVSTLAGGSFGLANGKGKAARFETLSGITYAHTTSSYTSPLYFYVCDRQANNIRQITLDGVVTLVAGSPTGQAGYADGIGANALFNAPSGITADNSGFLYVADSGNARIRMINLSTYQVTTLAGTGTPGTADGPGASAQFLGPNGITGGAGPCCGVVQSRLMITDAGGGAGSFRQLDKGYDGSVTVTTIKTGLIDPKCLSSYNSQTVYLDNQALYRYQGANPGQLLAGTPGSTGFNNGASGALFNNPAGTAAFGGGGSAGLLYLVSDAGNNVIRVVRNQNSGTAPGPYPTYNYIGGGSSGTAAGYVDGGYRTAMFNQPGPMITYFQNNKTYIYVCDVGNHAIRIFF